MRTGTCVHFTGTVRPVCAAGVNYRKHVGGDDVGWGLRMPCITESLKFITTLTMEQKAEIQKRVPCEKYQEPTTNQIKQSDLEVTAAIDRLKMTIPLCQRIKREHKGKNWQGVEVCPACKGRLHLSHSALNGHVWGKCETKGCVSWVE